LGFADDFYADVNETIGGQEYSLPYLGVDDLSAISRQVQAENKVKALAAIGLTDAVGRQETAAYFDAVELDIDDLARLALTPAGAARFVARSLARAGRAADAPAFLQAFAAERGHRALVGLAVKLGTFGPRERRKPEPAPPNGGAPAGGQPAGDGASPASGHAGGSSSAEPSTAATPAG
jgi:hypothetical protein